LRAREHLAPLRTRLLSTEQERRNPSKSLGRQPKERLQSSGDVVCQSHDWIGRSHDWIASSHDWIGRSGDWIDRSHVWNDRSHDWIASSHH